MEHAPIHTYQFQRLLTIRTLETNYNWDLEAARCRGGGNDRLGDHITAHDSLHSVSEASVESDEMYTYHHIYSQESP